jgi:hypothetical protein
MALFHAPLECVQTFLDSIFVCKNVTGLYATIVPKKDM